MPDSPIAPGTPLARKLGIVPGTRLCTRFAPDDYVEWLAPLPQAVVFERSVGETTDVVHLFAQARATLERELSALRPRIRDDAIVWVSWPKKASKVETDLSDIVVRNSALALDLVDVKVCSVSDIWSGLKLVVPLASRQSARRSSR